MSDPVPLGAVFHELPPGFGGPITREGIENLREMGCSQELLDAAERALRRQEHKGLWRSFLWHIKRHA